jgi:hypothetical protein
MRVALIFFGQPRFITNEIVKEHYKKILDTYDVDIYGHLWWSENEVVYDVSTWSTINECPVLPSTPNIMNELYPNNKIIYEGSRDFNIPEKLLNKFSYRSEVFNVKNLKNVMSHLYSFEKSVSEVPDDYDFYIISRTDSIIYNLPDLNLLDNNKFYISNHHDNFPDLIFVFGKRYLNFMKTYSNLEFTIDNVWQPSAEAFKSETFKKYYSMSELNKITMTVEITRVF